MLAKNVRGHVFAEIVSAPLLVVAAASFVGATDRFYDDILIYSPSGAYRLEARSPDNKDGLRPFASHFTYTLYDGNTKRVLWKRKQPKDESPPVQAFVSEDKWVVIRTGWDQLVVIDPEGKTALTYRLLEDGIPKDEQEKYVHHTTAGARWSGYSHWYFTMLGGKPHFCVRAWWDHRVLINLADAKAVAIDNAARQHLDAAEKQRVLDILEANAGLAENWDKLKDEGRWKILWPVQNAIHLAGRLKIKEAIPFLRALEPLNYQGSSSSRVGIETHDGEVNPFSYSTFTLRRLIQLTLRRLDETPANLPATEFELERKNGAGEKVNPRPHTTSRAERVPQVDKRMSPLQVLKVLGAPDFVDGPARDAWLYCIDAKEPFTVLIKWEKQNSVSIEHSQPAWLDNSLDDEL